VYAHIYHSHFQQICTLGAEAHLNTCFKHFIYFTGAFGLVKREEQAPLGELVDGEGCALSSRFTTLFCVKTPVGGSQYSPCNQPDTSRE
jgi:hypothetical protein